MAKQRQTRDQLGVIAGDNVIIKGKVSFAKIDKAIDGDALVEENKRRTKYGMILADKPFRSISLQEIEFVSGADTPLAKYYELQQYEDKNGVDTLSLESKSIFPPVFGHMVDGKVVEIKDPEKNPNTGQVVFLVIDAFKPKNYNNLGSTFNKIVYGEGAIDFYSSGGGLEDFGEKMNVEVEPLANDDSIQYEPETKDTSDDSSENDFGMKDEDVQTNDNADGEKPNPFLQ